MNHHTTVNWASYAEHEQIDWVDHVITVEEWLLEHMGPKGIRWDWMPATTCRQIGFQRAQDCMWFKLKWS